MGKMDYKTLEPFTFWGKLAFLLDVINISKASVLIKYKLRYNH